MRLGLGWSCVCECQRVASVQGMFNERLHWPGHDVNATSRRRCVVTVHDKAMGGSWRGIDGSGGVTAVVRLLVWGEARVTWGVCVGARVSHPKIFNFRM
jgi:hypothetical protein